MTKSKVKSWLDIIIQDYIYEDVEDELIEMRDIIYNALDTQALKQQPSEDCINRKEAIKEFQVYREYSSNLTNNEWVDRIETVLVSLPSVNPVPNISIQITERENMEDLISRQAVLEKAIIVPIAKVVTEDKVICRKIVFVEDIQKLPSVTPQPKMGRWIEERDDYGEITHWHCSNCYDDSGFITTCKWDYCPNCGAKMEVADGK